MTIDELTVKITVAADEAEAALEKLLEKLQAFQEKTGMALQMDTGKWSRQLTEPANALQEM